MTRGAAVEVTEGALARLVGLIREETGNVVPRARHGFLEEIAARRARSRGFARAADYVAALASGKLGGEWEQLIPLVTVKESFFFRAPQQFAAIERHVLPVLARSRQTDRTLRIWCAASARGEEPATLALILAEHEALASWEWRIVATDLDLDALAAAERGLYGERAVAQVPERLRRRWFMRRGSLYELHPGIRGRIDYRPLNLARPPYRVLEEGPAFDLVLLRNVLIYFARPLQRRVLAEVTRRLSPDGYLFLGASETLWQIFDRLAPVELENCFGYRHPDRVPPRPGKRKDRRPARRPSKPPTGRERPRAGRAEGRNLPPSPDPERPARSVAEEPRPPRETRPAGGLQATGTSAPFDGEPVVSDEVAPEAPERAQPAAGESAQELVLGAARELAANRLDEASALAAKAREADPSEPAVYALEGFLHDLADRPEPAAAEYRAALYLDPGLFQARLLLADCLRRLGHRERAEHEFREVLASLDRGGARELLLLEELPLPNRTRALRRCRQALGGR